MILALLIAFTAGIAFADQGSKPVPAEVTAPADTATLKMPAALAAAGYTKFVAALKAAELTETLEAEGPFTCFAPTDKAFDAMPEEIKKLLAESPTSDMAQKWVKYHFIKCAAKRSELMKMAVVFGLAEKPLQIWVTPESISINRVCEITRFDIVAQNGIIHGVERVLNADDR
jgi:uncharacterized surface protein with fasciclin (FAS1) repeats